MKNKEFAATTLDSKHEIFLVYLTSLLITSLSLISSLSSNPLNTDIYTSCRFWIASLIVEKALTKVPAKYTDFADIFFLEFASQLPEYTEIKDHAIKLIDG